MRRQAPRSIWLEHVVVQHKVLCVGPVVRYFAGIMPAHHVGRASRRALWVLWIAAGLISARFRLRDESVHLAAVDIGQGARLAMRAAMIQVAWVVKGSDALPGGWV